MRTSILKFLFVFLACFYGHISSATIIDFEGLQDSNLVGTIGAASFTSAIIATSGDSLNEFEVPPKSGVNVAINSDVAMTISFLTNVDTVSGFITYGAPVTINAIGVSGILSSYTTIFSSNLAFSGDPASAPNEKFTLTSNALIQSLQFISSTPRGFALDDLSFDFSGTAVPGPTPLSEPNTVTLVIAGLFFVFIKRPRNLVRAARRFIIIFLFGTVSAASAQSIVPDLAIYPQNVPLGVAQTVTVNLDISDPAYIPASAMLNEVDINGNVIKRLATFADNGQGADEVAGDHRYTAQFILNEPTPRAIRVAASLGFAGLLTRTSSPIAIIWAAADADMRFGFAVAQRGSVVFKDVNGRTRSSIPLASYAQVPVTLTAGPAIRKTLDTAFVAESQMRVGIISNSTIVIDGEQEGTSEPSTFKYYGPSGNLLFTVNSTASKTFFVDPQKRYASRSGSRVILTEVAENETDPSFRFLDDSGTTLAQYSNIPGVESLIEVQLSSNGRYIGIVANSVSPSDRNIVISVIDTSNNLITQRFYDPSINPSVGLAENLIGSFNVIVGETIGEKLP